MPAIHRQERTESSHLRGRAGAKDITPLHQDIPSTMREELMELDRLELLQETTTTAPRLFESIILLQWREPLLIDSKTDTNQGKTTTGSTALTRTTLESIDVQMMTERIRLHSKLSAPYGWRNQTRGLFDAPTHYHLSIQHPQKPLGRRVTVSSLSVQGAGVRKRRTTKAAPSPCKRSTRTIPRNEMNRTKTKPSATGPSAKAPKPSIPVVVLLLQEYQERLKEWIFGIQISSSLKVVAWNCQGVGNPWTV
ncbi:hypothetical protein YC2023_041910 [Brassica napus]